MIKKALVVAVLALTVCAGCATNPVSGRTELRVISKAQEVQMGRNLDSEIRKQYEVITGTAEADKVERIGRSIATVSDRQDVQYHFALLESAELNAFAVPGGYIYVTSELVRVSGSDAELAAVMAHEVGHVAALHSVNQMQKALGYSILRDLVLGEDEAMAAAADIAFTTVVMTGFSRQDEFQADELGVRYASRAGYDPYGLADFFVKLDERNRETAVDRAFEFMMSHPDTRERRRRAEIYAVQYGGAR